MSNRKRNFKGLQTQGYLTKPARHKDKKREAKKDNYNEDFKRMHD
jgi:hypothetical protein